MTIVDEVRSFNRFYTREIGLLAEHLPASDLSLAEARVLYELAQTKDLTAAAIVRVLGMDKGHVSRIAARFEARGLLTSRISPGHGKHKLLSLTREGRAAFAKLNHGTQSQIEEILLPVAEDERERLVAGMQMIQAVLKSVTTASGRVSIRGLQVGDLGRITERQAILYNREYGWDWTYEGLVAKILGEFATGFDVSREDAWVAAVDGRLAGSVFLMKSDDQRVAKLRLLYVEPWARGLGVGSRLVSTCIGRARELGFSSLTLWTNDVLKSARRIYEAAGFRLTHEEAHRSFGFDLVGQTWVLNL